MEDEFFKVYGSIVEEGIPYHTMNVPLVTNNLESIGLELETEGRGLLRQGHLEKIVAPHSRAVWTTHQDGSLRGEALEYVLSVPCRPDEISGMVEGLFDAMKTAGTKLNNSNRTSTHVHYNMHNRKINTVTSAIALWVTFEELIIPWCGEERKTNHFCLSTKEASASLVPAWERYLRTGNTPEDRNLKYSALNILPVFGRGSFEIRCGPVPDDAKTVIEWAHFVNSFLKYSERYVNPASLGQELSEKGATALFMEASDGGRVFHDIIKSMTTAEFEMKAMEGFRRCQSIVMGHPWNDWLSLINKEYIPNPFGKSKKKPPRVRLGGVEFEDAPDAEEDRPTAPLRDRMTANNVMNQWVAENAPEAVLPPAFHGPEWTRRDDGTWMRNVNAVPVVAAEATVARARAQIEEITARERGREA